MKSPAFDQSPDVKERGPSSIHRNYSMMPTNALGPSMPNMKSIKSSSGFYLNNNF